LEVQKIKFVNQTLEDRPRRYPKLLETVITGPRLNPTEAIVLLLLLSLRGLPIATTERNGVETSLSTF